MEVLRDLAGTAGVELDGTAAVARRAARRASEAESERDRMFRAMELAAAFFEEQYAAPGRRRRPRLRRKRGIWRRRRASASASATRPARWDALSRTWRPSRSPRRSGAPGPGGRERARALRLLPRPGDAAGARSPEARDRLRRAAPRSRGQGPQVRQLAGLAALPQEGAALRPARGAGRHPPQRDGRSSSRGTSTCWRCTRPASRRRSRPWARR